MLLVGIGVGVGVRVALAVVLGVGVGVAVWVVGLHPIDRCGPLQLEIIVADAASAPAELQSIKQV